MGMNEEMLHSALANYPGEMLLIRGEEGDTWFEPGVEYCDGRFDNFRVLRVPGGHHPHLGESAEAIASIITEDRAAICDSL